MPENDEQTTKRRAPPVSYRPPRGREAEFYACVAASGLSVNGFITRAVFGTSRRHRAQMAALAGLLAETTQISDALHEIALTGPERNALPLEQALAELAQIRAALLILMRRGP